MPASKDHPFPATFDNEAGQPQPFLVTRKSLFTLFGSPRLAQRLIQAGWIAVVRRGSPGRETLFDYESAKGAFQRLKRGEEPPLLACETRRQKT
jgi:hypothetical protein